MDECYKAVQKDHEHITHIEMQYVKGDSYEDV